MPRKSNVELGLSLYIQAGLAAMTPPVIAPGGFLSKLPKDQISASAPMAFGYQTIASPIDYSLEGAGWTIWHVQIDCYGFGPTAAASMALANAIDAILRPGFSGRFADPGETLVFQIHRLDQKDGFSDANRSFVRSLDYSISYQQV